MAAYIGTHGHAAFGGGDVPHPATVVMQYTGHTECGSKELPTFAICGTRDGITNYKTMKQRIEKLKKMGVDANFIAVNGLPHGFGLGIGTKAEGWIDSALKFWEKHI